MSSIVLHSAQSQLHAHVSGVMHDTKINEKVKISFTGGIIG